MEGGSTPTFGAAALVQASLNALSCSAGSEPLQMLPTDLVSTTPVAAAVVVQVTLISKLVTICLLAGQAHIRLQTSCSPAELPAACRPEIVVH